MPEAKELLSILRNMRIDPAMQDFHPLINEMMTGLEVPDYDNIEIVLDLFFKNDLAYHCNQLAQLLHHHSSMTTPHKKWYEMDN